jgi:hypothetical protein
MPEFDIDNLKKTWQEQPVQPKYDSTEILNMLNKKSRNYVKYIFWISVVEFLFFFAVGVFYMIKGESSDSLTSVLTRLGVTQSNEFDKRFEVYSLLLKIVGLVVTAFFAIKFYANYKKIHIEENLKSLITRIIGFKKTVNAFIFTNIVLFCVYTLILVFLIVQIITQQHVSLDSSKIIRFVAAIVVAVVLGVVILLLYYKIVYGIIISKLDKNLQQLKEIEKQTENNA